MPRWSGFVGRGAHPCVSNAIDPGPSGEANLAMSDHLILRQAHGSADVRARNAVFSLITLVSAPSAHKWCDVRDA